MINITNSLLSATNCIKSAAVEQCARNPHIAFAAAVGLAAAAACGYYFTRGRPDPADLKTIRHLAREIQELKPTIGDGASYKFVASHKKYIDENKTKAGSLSVLAAGLNAKANGKAYGKSPDDIMKLGEALLTSRSGQCDHMAAAVVAKIVRHLKQGGTWNSKVEVVGNGGHAFVIIGRQGALHDPETWGRQTLIVDTWLSCLGVHPDYASQMTAGDHGVVFNFSDVVNNAHSFGAERLKVVSEFSADDLRKLSTRDVASVA